MYPSLRRTNNRNEWHLIKMSKSKLKRIKEREAWRELQLIIKGYRSLGFNYMVERQPMTKLCFGLSKSRDVLPTDAKNFSPLMRRLLNKITPETTDRISPETIPAPLDTEIKTEQIRLGVQPCKEGTGPFSSKTPRFQYLAADGNKLYNPNDNQLPVKRSIRPFGSALPRFDFTSIPTNNEPGPGTYTIKMRRHMCKESFNQKRDIIPATRSLCIPIQNINCLSCSSEPKGDYWQNWYKKGLESLCRSCMETMRSTAKKAKTNPKCLRTLTYLDEFERVRHCSYCHDHQGTTASIKLWPKRDLRKKFQYENYLHMFEFEI